MMTSARPHQTYVRYVTKYMYGGTPSTACFARQFLTFVPIHSVCIHKRHGPKAVYEICSQTFGTHRRKDERTARKHNAPHST